MSNKFTAHIMAANRASNGPRLIDWIPGRKMIKVPVNPKKMTPNRRNLNRSFRIKIDSSEANNCEVKPKAVRVAIGVRNIAGKKASMAMVLKVPRAR